MEKKDRDRIIKCLKLINVQQSNPETRGAIGVWRVKDIFAREFPEIKDEINKL